MRETLEAVLKEDGYEVEPPRDGAEAVMMAKAGAFDVVLLDLRMPDCTGLDILPELKTALPEAAVIMMTAYGTVKTAVEAVKNGAYDFLTKPFDLDEMRLLIKKALELQTADPDNAELRSMLQERMVFPGDRRHKQGHAGGIRRHPESRQLRRDHPDQRGERDRKGNGGSGHPP